MSGKTVDGIGDLTAVAHGVVTVAGDVNDRVDACASPTTTW